MRNDKKSVTLIAKLLRETSSLAIVSEFLKEKGLLHSASSWDEMISKRLLPAIRSKDIVIQDLIELLRNVEEYGHQHVFLYRCAQPDAATIMGLERVYSIIRKCGLGELIDAPKVLDQPQSPEISDIRWEHVLPEKSQFIIKIIETRETSELLSEESKGDILTKRWRVKKERAVNLFKLHADGLLELRIKSQSNSTKYKSKVDQMWQLVADFLPNDSFQEISLDKVKERLGRDQELLKDKIRFSDVTLKNDAGNTIKAVTGSCDSNLYEDNGIKSSVNGFIGHNNAYYDSHNIWFKIINGSDQDKQREIHVLLSGDINEFAITAHCSSQEYEYVYDQLRNFNK